MSEKANSLARIFLSLFYIATLFRLWTLIAMRGDMPVIAFAPDTTLVLYGLASDAKEMLAISLLLFLCCFEPLRIAVLLSLGITLAGNHAYIIANGANLHIANADQAMQYELIAGSVLVPSILLPMVGTVMGYYLLVVLLKYIHPLYIRTFSLLLMMGMIASTVFPPPSAQGWMIYSLAEENAEALHFGSSKFVPHPVSNEQLNALMQRDLSGHTIVASNVKTPNVLLISVESMSAEIMDRGWTPNLKKWTEKGLYYENFISLGRRSPNGLYAILCGDYPVFARKSLSGNSIGQISKVLDVIDAHKPILCLPNALARQHYGSMYFQATNIRFDHWHLFAPLAGFKESYGDINPRDTGRNAAWGPNDQTFFKQVRTQMKTMQGTGKPWLLMAATIGTHDPYELPASFMANEPKKKATFFFMDNALDALLKDLEAKGVRQNTLILITSDESGAEISPNSDGPETLLPEHRGFLLVLTPKGDKAHIRELFTQADLMMSILDYTGADTADIPYGRSIFRTYDSFRPLYFGSVYSRRQFGLVGPKNLIMCRRRSPDGCTAYAMDSEDLFHTKFHEDALPEPKAGDFLSLMSAFDNRVLPRPLAKAP